MEILEQIELQSKQVEDIRKQLIVPKKIQLHTGLPGFESPKAYGVYRNTGGKPLGVVGESFRPMNLNHFLDSVVNSITNSGVELDISKLQYNEYYEGSRVSFTIPLKVYEIAEAGVTGLNRLFGWGMSLDEKNDNKGDLKSVYFSSKILKFNAPVKKSEPLQ